MSDVPSLWPCLTSPDPRALITFLTSAFGLTERAVYADGHTVHHAELTWTGPAGQLGGVMLGPADPAEPDCGRPPGGAAVHVVVGDPDAVRERAVAAGARIVREIADADYGSRLFVASDPDGNLWSFGTWYE